MSAFYTIKTVFKGCFLKIYRWVISHKKISIFLLLMGALLTYCQNKAEAPRRPPIGRDYRSLSIHPNEKDMLFIECSEKQLSTPCGIFRYDMSTQKLYQYNMPEGYIYHSAQFSPKGNYIVMHRSKLWKDDPEKTRQENESAEILTMQSNGKNLHISPMPPGPYARPFMSNNEDKIAYWTMKLRDPGSKSFAARYNLWEIDLNTSQRRLFAGDFQFFEIDNAQYLSNDKAILIDAYGPMTKPTGYMDQYNHSTIYILERGNPTLPKPMFTEVENATQPSMDKAGNIYFRGQTDRVRFFKTINGKISQEWPIKSMFATEYYLGINPNGTALFFTYELYDDDSRFGKYSRDIAKFDVATQTWQTFSIPPFTQAEMIDVISK